MKAQELIDKVVEGESACSALDSARLTEDKLAAVDPKLDKMRKKAQDTLLDAAALVRKIANEVTIKSISKSASKCFDQIKQQVEALENL